MDFVAWSKIPRLHRDWEITEKVDGTNGILSWTAWRDELFEGPQPLAKVEDLYLFAGSRTRWLTPEQDNFGFAAWAKENAVDLWGLGPGRHFGEWFGKGIQRGYGLLEKRFALFTTGWSDEDLPKGVEEVPTLHTVDGSRLNMAVELALEELRDNGSVIAPGFMQPEGIVVRHKQHGGRFKVLLHNDNIPKEYTDVVEVQHDELST